MGNETYSLNVVQEILEYVRSTLLWVLQVRELRHGRRALYQGPSISWQPTPPLAKWVRKYLVFAESQPHPQMVLMLSNKGLDMFSFDRQI